VDGNDYYLWGSLTRYRPRLVVLGFNARISNDVDLAQEADAAVHQAWSLAALVRLGREKGYEPVATSDFNAFVRPRRPAGLFGIDDNSIDAIPTKRAFQTHVSPAPRRAVCWDGCTKLIWHDVELRPERLRPKPKRLRYLPDTERRSVAARAHLEAALPARALLHPRALTRSVTRRRASEPFRTAPASRRCAAGRLA
jgi:hypothetical protein